MNHKHRILLVEDDLDIRRGLTLLLRQHFEVLVAEDSILAMTLMRRHRPDAVVLDLGLPGGGGLRVLEWMQEVREVASIPVLVATGWDTESVGPEAMRLGARRVFQKPVDATLLREELEAAIKEAPALARRRVLLVEDDADTRRGMSMLLRQQGLEVHVAEDGATAVMMARRIEPDAILLDVCLPGGDGFRVLERLKGVALTRNVPVLVMSGYDRFELEARSAGLGANGVLAKPIDPSELLRALDGAMAVA